MRTLLFLLAVTVVAASSATAAPPKGKNRTRAKAVTPTATVVAPPAKPVPPPAPKAIHPAPMWAVTFSPDGKLIAVGTYRKVLLFDTATGAKAAEWLISSDAIRTLAYSPDGKLLAAGTGVPGQSGAVIVLDTTTGKPVRTIKNHDDTIEAVAFKGDLLLAAADDEKVTVTDVASGKDVPALTEHIGRCLSVAVPQKNSDNDGGDIFATGGADRAVKIWDAKVRRVVVNFDQSEGPIWCLAALNRPGRFVAGGGDGRIRFFGVRADGKGGIADGIPARAGFQERVFDNAHEGGVYAVAAAPNDSFLVSGGADGKVVVWDLGGGRRKVLTEATGDVVSVAVSPDGKQIAAASLDGKVRLYDAQKYNILQDLPEGVTAFSASGATPSPVDPTKSPSVNAGKALALGTGLRGFYFTNRELTGEAVAIAIDPTVDFTWNGQKPAIGVPGENFSVRWVGFVEIPVTGNYTFSTRSDDGVRLWVNGVPLIDNWTDHGNTEDTATRPLSLVKGQRVALRMEYYQGGSEAGVGLYWAYPGQERQVIPKMRLYPTPPASPKSLPTNAARVTKSER